MAFTSVPGNLSLAYSLTLPRYIPAHWMQFTVSASSYTALAAVASLIALVGIPANFIVIFIFITEKKLKTSSNFMLMNLSISDLMILVSNCPMSIAANWQGHWTFGEYGCSFYGFAGCFFGLTSINIIALIAIDRWYQITKSVLMKKISLKSSKLFIAGIWLYCLFWSVLPFFGINEFVLEGTLTSCTVNYLSQAPLFKAYNHCLFIFCFLVPLIIVMAAYVDLYLTLRRNRVDRRSCHRHPDQSSQATPTARDLKMAKIALYLILGYLFAWVPYATIYMLGVMGYGHLITPLRSAFPAIMAKTSAIYNPFIYLQSHKLFKQALIRRIRKITIPANIPSIIPLKLTLSTDRTPISHLSSRSRSCTKGRTCEMDRLTSLNKAVKEPLYDQRCQDLSPLRRRKGGTELEASQEKDIPMQLDTIKSNSKGLKRRWTGIAFDTISRENCTLELNRSRSIIIHGLKETFL